jgi:hypothetical protein
VPTSEFVQKLVAARLAADVAGVPTLLVARTDALGAFLLTSDIDERDRPFCTGVFVAVSMSDVLLKLHANTPPPPPPTGPSHAYSSAFTIAVRPCVLATLQANARQKGFTVCAVALRPPLHAGWRTPRMRTCCGSRPASPISRRQHALRTPSTRNSLVRQFSPLCSLLWFVCRPLNMVYIVLTGFIVTCNELSLSPPSPEHRCAKQAAGHW